MAGDLTTINVSITGTAIQSGTATCTAGSWTYTTSPTLTGEGPYTVTATQSDTAGNIGTSGAKSITIDTTPPEVTSIVRAGANPTSAHFVSWTVTFSESVSAVDLGDFTLASSGLTAHSLVSVTPAGSTNVYTVTASTGNGDGTLGLNLADDDSIKDLALNVLDGPGLGNGDFTGEVYTVDKGDLSIVKGAPASAAHGDVITYTFAVTLDAGADGGAAQNIVITDPDCNASPAQVVSVAFNIGDTDTDGYLDDGETWQWTCAYTVPAHDDLETNDPFPNTADVSGQDLAGYPVNGDTSNTTSVDIDHDAGTLALVKTADFYSTSHGSVVNYSFGSTYAPGADGSSAKDPVVLDDRCDLAPTYLSGDTDNDTFLDGSETWTYTCSFVIPLHDNDEDDPIPNTGTLDGKDFDGVALTQALSNEVSVDIVHDSGDLAIVKSADVTEVAHGGTVTYTFSVTYAPGPDTSPAKSVVVTDGQCDASPAQTLSGGFNVGDTDLDGYLDGGETWEWTCAHTVAASHLNTEEDPILNTASVAGDNVDDVALTTAFSDEVSVNVIHDAGTLTIVKSADVTEVAHGGTVNYTFDVTYLPGADNSPAKTVSVSDAQCDSAPVFQGGDTDGDTFLDGDETWTYTCSYAVAASHLNTEEDPILNTASVSGTDLDDESVSGDSSDEVSVNVIHDAGTLTIVKSADVTEVAHGGTVNYTFDVTYLPGADNSPAKTVSVSDAQCDSAPVFQGGDTDGDTFLDGDETWTYTCSYAVAASHLNTEEDPILNTASVSGTDLDDESVSGDSSDEVSVNVIHDAGTLTIVKSADVTEVAHGGTVNYTFDVTYLPGADNSPAKTVSVSDAQCDSAPVFQGGDTDGDTFLDGDETWTYTCSYAVAASHLNTEEDPILNTASVSGTDLDDESVSGDSSDEVSVNVIHDAGTLTIVKSADVTEVAHGGTVNYTFDVTYLPGADNSPAKTVSVSDAQCDSAPVFQGGDTDGDTFLDGDETWTYTCSYAVAASHLNTEEDPILNTASVSGTDLDDESVSGDSSDEVSVNVIHDAGTLTIVKSADVTEVAHGGTVNYTFDVTYLPGADNSPAKTVSVSDAQCDSAPVFQGGDTDGDTFLDGDETWTYTCSYAVAASHLNTEEDPILNTASVSGTDLDDESVSGDSSDEVSVNVIHDAGTLTIVKSADVLSTSHGTVVTYTLEATYAPGNDGSPARDVLVADARCDNAPDFMGGDTDSDTFLDGAETWTYECMFVIPLHGNGEDDPILNTGTVGGDDYDGETLTQALSSEVSVDIDHDSGTLSIVKSAPLSAGHGDLITYTFDVSYLPGLDGAPAQDVSVTDADCDVPGPAEVLSGLYNVGDLDSDNYLDGTETWQWTCAYTVPVHADGETNDPFTNTASADGDNVDADPLLTATSNTTSVDIDHDSGTLSIVKSAPLSAGHGDLITYTFDVSYLPGLDGAPAQDVSVTDADCDVPGPAEVLSGLYNVGDLDSDNYLDGTETWQWTCAYTVPVHADGETNDPFTNTASADGDNVDADPLLTATSNTTSVDIDHDSGTLSIVKSAPLSAGHGDLITYTFDVSYLPGLDGAPAQDVSVTDADCDVPGPAEVLSGLYNVGDLDSDNYLDGTETWQWTCAYTVPVHADGETNDPFTNTASADGDNVDADPLLTATSNTTSVDIDHDSGTLSIVKSADVTQVAHGGTVNYTFLVTYVPGTDGSPATAVIVTDAQCDLPPAYVSGDDGDGLLEAGETWTYTCSHAVASLHNNLEDDPIVNVATVDATDLDGDAITEDSNEVSVGIIHADLGISTSTSANPVTVGDEFDYIITVTNHGPSANTGFTVSHVLPIELSFVLPMAAGCVEAPAGTITCTSLGLLANASVVWTIRVRADLVPAALSTAEITTTSPTDPNLINNSHSVTTSIVPGTLLSDVAAGDPSWQNHLDGVDVLFQKTGSNATTNYKLKATNPGTFRYRLELENETGLDIRVKGHQLPTIVKNGVSLKDRNGASTTVFLTVPTMPGSTGTPIPSLAGMFDQPAFVLDGNKPVRAHPDSESDDHQWGEHESDGLPVVVSYIPHTAPAVADCSTAPSVAYIPLPSDANGIIARCIRIEGLEIKPHHNARIRVAYEFRWKDTTGWGSQVVDPTLAFRAGFNFKSTTVIELLAMPADLETRLDQSLLKLPAALRPAYKAAFMALWNNTYKGSHALGLVFAGERMTAIGGFAFNPSAMGIAGIDVRLWKTAQANYCAGTPFAQTTTGLDGFYFIWKNGADQSNPALTNLDFGPKYYVALCDPNTGDNLGMPFAQKYWPARQMDHNLGNKEFVEEDFFVSGPTSLAFTSQPVGGRVNRTLGTVKVAVIDGFGQVLTLDTGAGASTITLSETGPGTLTSASSLTKSLSYGVATWTDLKLSLVGLYQLVADASGPAATVPDETSLPINITP